jgi:hypothetical protein
VHAPHNTNADDVEKHIMNTTTLAVHAQKPTLYPHDNCPNCGKEHPTYSKLCNMRKAAKRFTSCPKPSTTHSKNHLHTVTDTQHPTFSQQTTNPQLHPTLNPSLPQSACNQNTHNHPNCNLPSYYLFEALPSETEFCTMSDTKAIENICMVLPVSEEEVRQANIKIKSPHNWHNVATEIIKEYNESYINNTNMDKEDY